MEATFDIDLVAHLAFAKSVDLRERGYYYYEMRAFYGDPGENSDPGHPETEGGEREGSVCIAPIGCWSAPVSLTSRVRNTPVSPAQLIQPAHVDDAQSCFRGRAFRVRYREEVHELNEACHWRVSVGGADLAEPSRAVDDLYLVLCLFHCESDPDADLTSASFSASAPLQWRRVSSSTLRVRDGWRGVHALAPMRLNRGALFDLSLLLHCEAVSVNNISLSLAGTQIDQKAWIRRSVMVQRPSEKLTDRGEKLAEKSFDKSVERDKPVFVAQKPKGGLDACLNESYLDSKDSKDVNEVKEVKESKEVNKVKRVASAMSASELRMLVLSSLPRPDLALSAEQRGQLTDLLLPPHALADLTERTGEKEGGNEREETKEEGVARERERRPAQNSKRAASSFTPSFTSSFASSFTPSFSTSKPPRASQSPYDPQLMDLNDSFSLPSPPVSQPSPSISQPVPQLPTPPSLPPSPAPGRHKQKLTTHVRSLRNSSTTQSSQSFANLLALKKMALSNTTGFNGSSSAEKDRVNNASSDVGWSVVDSSDKVHRNISMCLGADLDFEFDNENESFDDKEKGKGFAEQLWRAHTDSVINIFNGCLSRLRNFLFSVDPTHKEDLNKIKELFAFCGLELDPEDDVEIDLDSESVGNISDVRGEMSARSQDALELRAAVHACGDSESLERLLESRLSLSNQRLLAAWGVFLARLPSVAPLCLALCRPKLDKEIRRFWKQQIFVHTCSSQSVSISPLRDTSFSLAGSIAGGIRSTFNSIKEANTNLSSSLSSSSSSSKSWNSSSTWKNSGEGVLLNHLRTIIQNSLSYEEDNSDSVIENKVFHSSSSSSSLLLRPGTAVNAHFINNVPSGIIKKQTRESLAYGLQVFDVDQHKDVVSLPIILVQQYVSSDISESCGIDEGVLVRGGKFLCGSDPDAILDSEAQHIDIQKALSGVDSSWKLKKPSLSTFSTNNKLTDSSIMESSQENNEDNLRNTIRGGFTDDGLVRNSARNPQNDIRQTMRPTLRQTMSGRDEEDGEDLHVVVLMHGYLGCSADMKLLSNALLLDGPTGLTVLNISSSDDCSDDCIEEMARRLTEEFVAFVDAKAPLLRLLGKLSFVCHSMGGLVARHALTLPAFAPFLARLHAYVSLASPHLGTIFSDSQLVSFGQWALSKVSRKADALKQLSLQDERNDGNGNKDINDCFLVRLSASDALSRFKVVCFVSSPRDMYVPHFSASVRVNDNSVSNSSGSSGISAFTSSGKSNRMLAVVRKMAENILSGIEPERLIRLTIDDKEGEDSSINSAIGRTAHICYLENPLLVTQLIHTLYPVLSA